jgi:hypothetical protein
VAASVADDPRGKAEEYSAVVVSIAGADASDIAG